jgi:hypothetical protein
MMKRYSEAVGELNSQIGPVIDRKFFCGNTKGRTWMDRKQVAEQIFLDKI